MPTKDEIKLAQGKLDAAVEAFVNEMGWNETGVMTAWCMVTHQAGFDGDGDSWSAHNVIYMGGSQPDHVAVGLFTMGVDTVRGIGRWTIQGDEEL